MKRRDFIARTTLAGLSSLALPMISFPDVLTKSRTIKNTVRGKLIFKPYFVQKGRGLHLYELVWASDKNWDTFYSDITLNKNGVEISDSKGIDKFGVTVRWNVEGFGYTNITADNGGEYYQLPDSGNTKEFNLVYELAKSRIVRNRTRSNKFVKENWILGRDTKAFLDLSEEFFNEAVKHQNDDEKCAQLSQKSLYYALWGGEKMELEKAELEIIKRGLRKDFLFGCDARGFYQMNQEKFFELYAQLFNYAKVTFIQVNDAIPGDLEPQEDKLQFGVRDLLIERFREHNIICEGRALFWFHHWVTPDWVKNKPFDELKKYVEKHTCEVVKHHGQAVYAWEIVNELHDWANECLLTPEQTVELTKLACDVAYATEPKVHRLINNCCPCAEYVQMKQWSGQEAKYRQRTPNQFLRDLVDAGVNFDIVGQQMYFPYRDLQDTIIMIERLAEFNKPVQLTEVGCPAGPTNDTIRLGTSKMPNEPYIWHRYWDEETQSEWFEGLYKLAFSKPYIESISWFDMIDPYVYMENGGLLKSREGAKKPSYDRMKKLLDGFKSLPLKF